MADIKQAAKWLQEDKAVRRVCQRKYAQAIVRSDYPHPCATTADGTTLVKFSFDDLLAEDWEVVE